MKKKLLGRTGTIIGIVLICLTLTAFGVFAATHLLSVTSSVNVTTTTVVAPNLAIYTDSNGTTQVHNGDTHDWGNVGQGGNSLWTVYAKNTGNQQAVLSVTCPTPPTGITVSGGATVPADGSLVPVEIFLIVNAGASTGAKDVTLSFDY